MTILFRLEEATRTPDPHVPNVVRYQLRYFSILLRKIFGIAWDFVVFKVGKQGTPPSFTPANNLIPSRILVVSDEQSSESLGISPFPMKSGCKDSTFFAFMQINSHKYVKIIAIF